MKKKQWIERHVNDFYVKESRRLNYKSRAAFKLIEINEKFKILKNNHNVLDLGCAPGGWLQVIAKHVKGKKIVGVDLLKTDCINGVKIFQGDFNDLEVQDKIRSEFTIERKPLNRNTNNTGDEIKTSDDNKSLDGKPYEKTEKNEFQSQSKNNELNQKHKEQKDLEVVKKSNKGFKDLETEDVIDMCKNAPSEKNVILGENIPVKKFIKINTILSDISPSVTGNKDVDRSNMRKIADSIILFALKNLSKKGQLLFKYFKFDEKELEILLKKYFESVRFVKPKVSRAESSEIFILAQGYKGINKNEGVSCGVLEV